MNRILPAGSAEPGRWRTSRTPYLIPIMQAAVDPRYRRVVAVMGSQMGKTELLLNLIGHRLDIDPAPVLFIGASQRQVEQISGSRVARMIRSTPSLDAKLDKRKTANKLTEKSIAGQSLRFAWAGSAIELSSTPAALVLLDERDRMEDVLGEGDPLALAEARTATYPDGKIVVTSTPTIEGASPIWSLFEGGTKARWSWPCADCRAYFVPSFDGLKWTEKASPSLAKKSARLACPHCGALIEDKHRSAMNAAGRYELSGDPDSDCASFWVSGLASPWRSWGDAARSFVEAARSHEVGRVQAIKNTIFGELFTLQGEAPPPDKVAALKGTYRFDECPTEARLLTCGVDLQKDRLYYVIRAWGVRATSWLIRHGELWGETDQAGVWADLAALLDQVWGGQRIRLMLVDSGFRPDLAYDFARRFPGRVLPSKGHDEQSKPVYVSKLQVDMRGKTSRRGVSLAHVDAGYFKAFVHGRIVWPIDQPGAWHLPMDATDDYCDQLLAESRVVKPNGRVIWVRSKKANHFLDCEALAAAAAHLLNVHVIERKPEKKPPVPVVAGDPFRTIRRPQPQRRNWVTGWK